MINTNLKKQDRQTTRLIQRLNNNIQLQSVDVIVSEKFCFRKCVCLLFASSLAQKTILLPNRQREQSKTSPIFTGYTCVEDTYPGDLNFLILNFQHTTTNQTVSDGGGYREDSVSSVTQVFHAALRHFSTLIQIIFKSSKLPSQNCHN